MVVLVVITLSVLQGPVKDVHMARGFSYKKSVHQIPAHKDLYRDIRKESVGNMVSLGKDSIPFQIKDKINIQKPIPFLCTNNYLKKM